MSNAPTEPQRCQPLRIIADTFSSPRPTDLEHHAATGPHGGFRWRHLRAFENTVKVVAAEPGAGAREEGAIVSPGVSRTYKYLAEAPLASFEQRVCVDVLDWARTGRNAQAGVYACIDDALNGYTFKIRSQPSPTYRLRLTENISDDEIEHDLVLLDGELPAPPFTLCLEVRRDGGGCDLQGLINDTMVIRAHDNRHAGGAFTALSIQGDSGTAYPTRLANFIATAL
jgi:hypothetical protein